jgi:ADP-heptose:LPS heptosyltransferase
MIEEIQQTFAMSFLHELALNEQRVLSTTEQAICDTARQALQQADAILIYIGGKAGRLGECVVATGLLEGLFHTLKYVGKAGTPVSLYVDGAAGALFDERSYREAYWPQITVHSILPAQSQGTVAMWLQQVQGRHLLILDLHGAHDDMPSLQIEELASGEEGQMRRVVTLAHLFRVGVRSYAQRGPLRRYADFVENLFGLPVGAIEDLQAQPCIRLSEEDEARYPELARQYPVDSTGGAQPHYTQPLQIICFFQSVVIAKCYCHWDEVMMQLCQYMEQHFPQEKIDFLIACGPDDLHPEGLKQVDFIEEFGGFSGVNGNAQVRVVATASLRDLTLLTRHSVLALSNDTGPGHIAGALQVPTITPYLPGNIYSRKVWSSTLWHRGVTLDPSPFSYQQIEAAVLWDRTHVINSIPSEQLLEEAIKSLLPRLQTR